MLSLFFSLALAAAAPDAVPAAPATTTAAKPEKPKKICRTDDNTGSRLKRKSCKTQAEWDNQAKDVQNDTRVNSGAGGN